MRKCFIILMILGSGLFFSAKVLQTKESFTGQEIRDILCEIENENYLKAQNNLEKILQKEPQNIYAQRLLPGVLTHQIKKDDNSSENIAQIRKTIEAYQQFAKIQQISTEESARANNFIIRLYEFIGEEEKTAELLKMADDKSLPSEIRFKFYSALAELQYRCADHIINQRKKTEKSEIEKAKSCISKGLEYTNQAITLDNNNDSAWMYRTFLLKLSSKIAESEDNQTQKVSLQKEADQAFQRFKEIRDKKDKQELNKQEKQKTGDEKYSEELIHYKAENSLDKLIKEIYIPSSLLVGVPVPLSDEGSADENTNAESAKDDKNQKREWKEFSARDDEFTADLPDNVKVDFYENASVYTASSEDVVFMIMSQPKPSSQTSEHNNFVLNSLAWGIVITIRNFSLMGDSIDSFEVNYIREMNLSGQPGKLYTYTQSCSCKTGSTLLVLIGKNRNYAININNANEQDPRTQRFLKSLKIIARNN